MKHLLTAAALLLIATPAWADQCDVDIAKIDKAMAAASLPPDQKAQLQDMKKQVLQLCKSGHEQEGLDVAAEAKAMLSIE